MRTNDVGPDLEHAPTSTCTRSRATRCGPAGLHTAASSVGHGAVGAPRHQHHNTGTAVHPLARLSLVRPGAWPVHEYAWECMAMHSVLLLWWHGPAGAGPGRCGPCGEGQTRERGNSLPRMGEGSPTSNMDGTGVPYICDYIYMEGLLRVGVTVSSGDRTYFVLLACHWVSRWDPSGCLSGGLWWSAHCGWSPNCMRGLAEMNSVLGS